MASTSSKTIGRTPHQERAARRRSSILNAAADLIAEVGFESTTMTGIAERADASVGALYDYFPDKTSIALALLNQYAEEIEAQWQPLIARAESMPPEDFAGLLIETMLTFMRERPAHLQLMTAPVKYTRDPAARKATRTELAKAFRAKNPSLTSERAFIAANVSLQLLRGMKILLADAEPEEMPTITADFQKILKSYLADVLSCKD